MCSWRCAILFVWVFKEETFKTSVAKIRVSHTPMTVYPALCHSVHPASHKVSLNNYTANPHSAHYGESIVLVSNMSTGRLNLGLGHSVQLSNPSEIAGQFIDPEELHFKQPMDVTINLIPSLETASTKSSPEMVNSAHSNTTLAARRNSTNSAKSHSSCEAHHTGHECEKAYLPRRSPTRTKATRRGLRIKPRNGQHARELERNRNAAASYRSRQKNQLDSLLTRVREEEQRMLKQKSMVYSLKDELWHLRNEFMARQQLQILGMSNSNLEGSSGVPSSGVGGTCGTLHQ